MRNLKLGEIKSVYTNIKMLAKSAFEKNNFEEAIKHIESAAEIAYMFNWIYSDNELESLLSNISFKIINRRKEIIPINNRIVLYDVFALDNRGLTQQYLRAFISWDVEILYIFEGKSLSNSSKILEELKAYPKAEVFIVDSDLSKENKINKIYEKIVEFRPQKAFLHLHPASAVATILWNSLIEVTRYQINLTDHAFWLGTKCIDYSLEFRDYGCTVSYEKRGLAKDQLLIQPYYPITDCKPFTGFPNEVKNNHIKIFTGGAYYKMYGKSGIFFQLLTKLLEIDINVIIIIAGSGNDNPLKEFIKNNSLEKRVFMLGPRPDITYIFEQCDIYLSTYPLTGGLMGQYAAVCKKPILTYTSADIPCNFSEGFIGWKKGDQFKLTHTEIDSFMVEAKLLIENESYRKEKGIENSKHIISSEEFSVNLKNLVNKNNMEYSFVKENIDYNVFSQYYIECENKYLNNFDSLIVSRYRLKTIYLFPYIFLFKVLRKISQFFLK